MLCYRGDNFVKGKKFTINESVYKFTKKSKDNKLIFEDEKTKKSLRISKEEFDEMSRYNLVQADSEKLDEFYNDSSLTFEGCTTDKENLDYLYNWLKELNAIKGTLLPIYTYKGSLMNEKYGLTGSNAYPNDLNFITVKLSDINYSDNLAYKRFEIGGRWFDDIVENNKYRQDRTNESTNMNFNESKILIEKVNQENYEMNQLIGKILRSKSLARKYEDELGKQGIKVDYDKRQGVTLIGPNGKELSSSTKEVFGPAKPGHNDTHKKPDSWYTSRLSDNIKYRDRAQAELEKLQAMDRDDIIRKYNTVSTERALAAHAENIERQEQLIADYDKRIKDYENNVKYDKDSTMRTKRAGHKGKVGFGDVEMFKQISNDKVDYLNYLTKKNYEKPYGKYYPRSLVGDEKQHSEGDFYYDSNYYGKNGGPSERDERLKKYDDLKSNIDSAKDSVRRSSQGSDSYFGYKSDEELEAEIQKMRDDLEKRIEALKANNESRKAGNAEDIERLKAREKELDDYLKSLGIRESVRTRMVKKAMLVESAKLNEGHEEHYEYVKEALDNLFEKTMSLKKEAYNLGYTTLADKLNKCLDIIEDYSFASDSIYTKKDGTAGRIMTAKEAKDSGIHDAIRKKKSEEK